MNVLTLILVPAGVSVILPAFAKYKWFKETAAVLTSLFCFIVSLTLITDPQHLHLAWAGGGLDFILSSNLYNAWLTVFASFFVLMGSIYSVWFMKGKEYSVWYYFNLMLSLSFVTGALLSGSLITLLFFWEAMVVVLYGFIALSSKRPQAKAAAMKAFIIEGIAGIFLLCGIAILTAYMGTSNLAFLGQAKLPLTGAVLAAFALMALGAVAKTGSFPFHAWLPNAAQEANLPFMAILPGALDKILGVYLLGIMCFGIFDLNYSISGQLFLLTLGAITLLLGDVMASLQNDCKKLITYSTIGQAGYLIMGIGCASVVGFAGAIFHLLNHSLYKVSLFFTAGNIEKQTGTTDITKVSGLSKVMPVTTICFVIGALSLLGIVPFNGFFSKELIYRGLLESQWPLFFLAAEVGSVFALFAFLKLSSVFFGKPKGNISHIKEAPLLMTAPSFILILLALGFGFGAFMPLSYIVEPMLASLGVSSPGHLSGMHFDLVFVISNAIIALAAFAYFATAKKKGGLYNGSQAITDYPVMQKIYQATEKDKLDVYNIFMKAAALISNGFYLIDRILDFIIDALPTWLANVAAGLVSRAHKGSYMLYFGWMLIGVISFAAMIFYFEVAP